MKIGKTTICAADIDRDKFQISDFRIGSDPKPQEKKKKNDQRKRNMRD